MGEREVGEGSGLRGWVDGGGFQVEFGYDTPFLPKGKDSPLMVMAGPHTPPTNPFRPRPYSPSASRGRRMGSRQLAGAARRVRGRVR